MTRELKKALGLAFAAILMTSAVGASVASAAEFHGEESITFIEGLDEGTDVLTTTAGTVECSLVEYELGAIAGFTTTTAIAEPEFFGCTAFGFASATVESNGCDYMFHNDGTVDITNCTGITIIASLFGTTKCTVTVSAQNGINGISYTNIGSGTTREITVDLNSSNIRYSEHGGTGFGACKSTVFEQTNGTYSGKARFTGYREGSHVGIWYA